MDTKALSELMPVETAKELMDDIKKKAKEEADQKKKEKLGNLLAGGTFPKANLQTWVVLEMTDVSIGTNLGLATVIWALMNQDNMSIVRLETQARTEEIMKVAQSIPGSKRTEYMLAVAEALDLPLLDEEVEAKTKKAKPKKLS